MPTVLGVLGVAGTVVLMLLLCWGYRECAREMHAATKTTRDQKSIIEIMSKSHNITRCQIENLESSVTERDETIKGLIVQIEGMRSEKTDSAVRIKSLLESLQKERSKLINAKQLAREIFMAEDDPQTKVLVQSKTLDSRFDPKPPEDQPQKPTCDN